MLKKTSITIGLTINKEFNKELTEDKKITVENIESYFSIMAKNEQLDFTFIQCSGTYNGNLEQSIIVECVNTKSRRYWKEKARQIAVDFMQDCVVLDHKICTSKLIYR